MFEKILHSDIFQSNPNTYLHFIQTLEMKITKLNFENIFWMKKIIRRKLLSTKSLVASKLSQNLNSQ